MIESPTGTAPPTASTQGLGWPFWRKRLARALVVAALALMVAQLLPALPEDQLVRLTPPPGVELTRAALTYYAKEGGAPLGGTEIVSSGPSSALTHAVRLPSDDYRISISAVGADGSGVPHHYTATETVTLKGSVAHVSLKPSKTAD